MADTVGALECVESLSEHSQHPLHYHWTTGKQEAKNDEQQSKDITPNGMLASGRVDVRGLSKYSRL
jgi:hypothetical protein